MGSCDPGTEGIIMKKSIAMLCALAMISGCFTGCAFTLSGSDDDDTSSSSTASQSSGAEVNGESAPTHTAQSTEGKQLYVTGTTEQIAMRASDEDTADVVAQLSLGDEVTLVSSDSVTYYFVSYAPTGAKGYVKKAYLTDEKSAVCKSEECFASKQIALYDTKESDHNEIQKLDAGTSVTVLAKTSGDFWFVNVTNTKTYGYVKCMELSTSKPVASSKAASSKAAASSGKPATTNNTNQFTCGPGPAPSNYTLYYAKVNSGYLAIRSAKAFDASNELGKMYTGDSVFVVDTSTGTYWYCYSPNLGVYGYVNSDYLVSTSFSAQSTTRNTSDYTVWTVSVNTGYLALRTAPAFDASNEIGKLYSGAVVYVYSYSYNNFSDVYWYVYSPGLGKWGYVNSNYIYS